MPKFEVDVCSDAEVGEVLEFLERHGATIADFEVVGPGGGNPCLTLELPTEEAVEKFKVEWNSSESNVFSITE